MNNVPVYFTKPSGSSNTIQYVFDSQGHTIITKAIQYSDTDAVFDGCKIFNFGFGDYDPTSKGIDDKTVSNNGDTRIVFNTVLNTVPLFFDKYPDAAIWVQGSDSDSKTFDDCKPNCRKQCSVHGDCKKTDRRIKIYRGYVDRDYNILNLSYAFRGGIFDKDADQWTLFPYNPSDSSTYGAIWVNKRK